MKLWSIQTEDVYNKVMSDGYCIVDRNKSECLYADNKIDEQFDRSYNWLVEKMTEKIGKPENVVLPWWAYYKSCGVRDLTLKDLQYFGTPGKEYMLLELEVPDNEVVLSDLDAWHFVLNNWWLDGSLNEEEWDKNNEWIESLSPEERQKVKTESWNGIFDIEPFENDWMSKGQSVQATFWILRKEYIKGYEKFISVSTDELEDEDESESD